MPDDSLIREPDENSGPAIFNREPIILPEQRKEVVEKGKLKLEELQRQFNR